MRYAPSLLIPLLFFASAAFARDGYADRPHACDMPSGPTLEKCQAWISTVRRPDFRTSSCCGDGDAFITDNFRVGPNGELYAIVTADYPDAVSTDEEGNTVITPAAIHRGSEILIPQDKVNHALEDANRSSHGVAFLLVNQGNKVICFFFPPLI